MDSQTCLCPYESAGTKCIYFGFSRVKHFLLGWRGSDICTHCLFCDKRKCVLHDSYNAVGKNEDVQLCVIWNEVRSYRNSVWGLWRSVYMEPMKMTEGLRWFNILVCFRSSLRSQQKSTGSLCEQLRSSRTNPRPCFAHLGWGMRTGDRIFHEEHISNKMLRCHSCRFTTSNSNKTQRWDFKSSCNITNYFHFKGPKVLIQNSAAERLIRVWQGLTCWIIRSVPSVTPLASLYKRQNTMCRSDICVRSYRSGRVNVYQLQRRI